MDSRSCSTCGEALAVRAPLGLCARCALRMVLAKGPATDDDDDEIQGGSPAPAGAPGGTAFNVQPKDEHEFAGYVLEGRIAEGGMGGIYRARHSRVDRVVALKRIRGAALAGPEARARFRAEVESAATLDHPNIVPIYEIGEHEGQPFFTMKLLVGGNLADRLAEFVPGDGAADSRSATRLGISSLIRCGTPAAVLMTKVARAIHFAHQRGILHRDIKPSNILLDNSGEPFVADFGLAKQLGIESEVTHSGQILGTPAYMSPEQAQGRNRELTVASDIFSLGAVLYHLLTGKRPFAGESGMDVMKAVVEQGVPHPARLNRHVDPDLATICLKCLEKRPADRYPSAEAVADELQRWLNREPIHARPPALLERGGKWARRKPALAGLCITGILLLLVLSIGGPLVAWREAGLRQSADESRVAADKARALTEARSEEVAANLYAAEMLLAGNELDVSEGVARVRSLTSRWRPEPGAKDRRGWEWHYLDQQTGQELFQLAGHHGGVHSVEWSSDGRWIATGGTEGRLRLYSATNAASCHDFKSHSPVRVVRFDRSGTLLAAAEDSGTVSVRDAETGQLRWKVRAARGMIFSLDWNPAGDRLVLGCGDGTVRVLRADDGHELSRLSKHRDEVRGVVWPAAGEIISTSKDGLLCFWKLDAEPAQLVRSQAGLGNLRCLAAAPDGQQLAIGRYDGSVILISRADGRKLREWTAHPFDIRQVAWSPDSSQLVSSSYDQTARIWELATGQLLKVIRGHIGRVQSVAWHPTQPRIVTAGIDAAVKVWDTAGRDHLELGPVGAIRLRWNSKGDRIAVVELTGRRLWLLDPEAGAVVREGKLPASAQSFAWHPDGTQLAVADAARGLSFWNANGEPLRQLAVTNALDSLDWSPDGRELAAYGKDGTLAILDPGTGVARRMFPTKPGLERVRWLRGGDQLILSGPQTLVLDAATGATRHEFVTPASIAVAVKETAGTNHFAVAQWYRDHFQTWSTPGPAQPAEWPGHTYTVMALDWHPTEPRLASGGQDRTIRIWNTDQAQQVLILRRHTADVFSLEWSPDGRRLASASRDGHVRLWNTRASLP